MAFVGIFSQINLLFGPLVIQLLWYILKLLVIKDYESAFDAVTLIQIP